MTVYATVVDRDGAAQRIEADSLEDLAHDLAEYGPCELTRLHATDARGVRVGWIGTDDAGDPTWGTD